MAVFDMERNIESVSFTNNNEFLLVAINAAQKPAQLCLLDNQQDGYQLERRHLEKLAQDKDIYGDELRIGDTKSKEQN